MRLHSVNRSLSTLQVLTGGTLTTSWRTLQNGDNVRWLNRTNSKLMTGWYKLCHWLKLIIILPCLLVLNVLSTASMRNTAASVSPPGKLLCKFIIRNIPSALILIIPLYYQVMIMNTYPESSNRPNVIREKGPTKRRNPPIASFYIIIMVTEQ